MMITVEFEYKSIYLKCFFKDDMYFLADVQIKST
jgi:hypothetical protein